MSSENGKGSDGLADRGWVDVQKKTFTNWINDKLKETDKQVDELREDLKDGMALITLLQILAPEKKMPGKYKKNPRMDIHKRENLDIAFRFLTNVEKVPLVNIGATDIYQGNLKLILGLVWALILRYQIAGPAPTSTDASPSKEATEAQKKRTSAKKLLLDWINATIPSKPAKNFTSDWNDGTRLSALVDYCKPGAISDLDSLDPNNALANITNAMEVAEKELGVPKLMSPEDLAADKPDELSVMTYVSGFCKPNSAGPNSLLDWVNSKIPNQPVSNFTSDWADGRALGALVDSLTEGGYPESEQMKEEDNYKNCQDAMEAAENLLGIKKTFSPEEFAENDMDHLTRSAFITQFRFLDLPEKETILSTIKAVGPGITGDSAEKETNFVVRAPRIPQWAKVEAKVMTSDGTELPLKQQRNSSRSTQFQYTPETPGDYTIDVTYNGEAIPGSTFNVTHIPPTNVEGCVATGSGLSKARVGENAGFSVNCENGGPGELQVDVEGPNGNVPVEMEEPTAKNYSVNFVPEEAGDHLVSVLWDSKNIPSSPFTCIVTDPKKCTVSGSGIGHGILGEPMTFTVKTDKGGPGELDVEIEGPNGSVPADIKEKSGGVFDVTYIPKDAGLHKLNVFWSKDPVAGSPFVAKVVAPADASKCTVSKLPEGKLRASNSYSFVVDASNAGYGEMTASAHGPTVPESCDVKESSEEGVYNIDFTPMEVGNLKVDVAYGEDPIPDSPFQFTVNDPTKVKVNRAAIENSEYLVKQPVQFAVSASRAGEGDLEATIRNPNGEFPMDMKDQGGKSYLLNYTPTEGGSHAINIKFDGSDIPDVPIRIFIDDSNRADKVVVTQPIPSRIGAFVVDNPYEYKVITADAGVDNLTATSIGAKTGQKPSVEVVSGENERYSVALKASKPDLYTVNILWGGEHVPGSPFEMNIEDTPQADKVVCEGPVYTVGSAPNPVTLKANAQNAGAGKLTASCVGESAGTVQVNVEETSPKKYAVSFAPPKDDIYSLSVLWESDSVTDSPFKINLIPPDASQCIVAGPEIPSDPANPFIIYVDASSAGNGKLTTFAIGDSTGEKKVDVKETEENKFVLSFVPELTDFYTWNVKWGDGDVPGAPFSVHSAAANADKVMICEPPSAMLEAGQAIGICFDASKGGKAGNLAAVCKGKNIGEIPIKVQQRSMDPDKYDVRFMPPEPDIFIVNVTWSGLDVKGSPFTINLMPVDVTKIRVIGPNMPHGSEGPVDMMLQTAGAGKGKVTGKCTGSNGAVVEVVIKETSTDIHELCFIPPEPDMYTFDVQYGGQKVIGSPFVINTLPADANLVKVIEPEVIGVSKSLVYRVDTSKAGSGSLVCVCRGDKSGQVLVDVTSEMTSHYNVSFIPRQTELYTLSMEWAGREVPGSPFIIDLRPPIAGKVKVGDLHVPDEIGEGNFVWIELDCTDAGHGPLKGEAKGSTAGKMAIEADRISRSKYKMKFPPTAPDIYRFAVAYGDSQVKGSPFMVNLMDPRPDQVHYTHTSLPELEGGPVSVHFDTTDAGRGEMTAMVTNDLFDAITRKVEKLSISEHKVTFIPNDPDVYSVHVKWNGEAVSGSPFKVDTRPPLHPELVECGKPVYTGIGEPVSLSVDTSKAGPGRVTATCQDKDKSNIPVDIKQPGFPKGKYNISFIPKAHGTYSISVYFEDKEVEKSPFEVNLNPVSEVADMVLMADVESLMVPDNFMAPPEEPPKEEPQVEMTSYIGDPFTVNIDVDPSQKGKIMVAARGDKVGPTDADVTKNVDGTYTLEFSPTLEDRYSINVTLDDTPVPNSPFIVNYIFKIDASKCKIFGLQNIPPQPQVNEPIHFGVDTVEAGPGKLSVTSDGPSQDGESSALTIQESEKEGEKGIFNITYLPTAMGEHRVHLLWDDEKIPGAPLIFKVGDISRIQRYPHGKPVTIDISADSTKTGDLDSYAIQEETGAKSKVKVSKEKKGKFKFTFQPKQPGIYAVHVLLKKKETPGSPYKIRYLGPPNPQGVVVSKFPGKGCVDCPISFEVNAEEAGTGELGIRVEAPKEVQDSDLTYSRNTKSKDLSYDVSYIPRYPGEHKFHISWAGKPIPDSPFKADVTDLKPEFTTALVGECTNIVEVGSPVSVRISNAGPNALDAISAECQSEKSPHVEVSVKKDDSEDNKFLAEFVPEVADNYTLNIKMNDDHIKGSPFSIKAIEKEKLSPDYPHPSEPQPSDVQAGEPVNVICDAPVDKSPSDLDVTVDSPYGPCTPTVVSDSAGKVGIKFIPPLSGDYIIKADDVSSCPCKITATGKEPDPSRVSILDKDVAIFKNPIPFGKPAKFRISTVDAGPGTLNITSKGPGKAKVKVMDNKDGTYTCDFSPSIAGKYHIDILWNETHIFGSPYLLNFKSKKNKMIGGLNLQDENFRIDIPHRFKLHCGEVGEGILEITTKPSSAAEVRLIPLSTAKNSYQCEIIPKETGNHEVSVQYNGKHILGSPFNCQFDERGDASQCQLVESNISDPNTDQERVNFVISTENAGKGKLAATVEQVSTKDQIPVTVSPLPENNKRYKVEFNPKEDEEYRLTIKYDGKQIPGSPFRLMFGGDAADAGQCTAEGDGVQACIVDKETSFVANTLRPNQGELSVAIKGEKTIMPKMAPLGSTQTEVKYTADKTGEYDISVKWANEDISGSPFHVVCYDPSDPSIFQVEDFPAEIFVQNPLNFSVKAAASSLDDGTLTVTAQSSKNKSTQGRVEKAKDGMSYDCSFDEFSEAGKYLIHVRWNGGHVKNSPFKVKVQNPPRPDLVKAYGPGLQDGAIGQEGNFTVETENGGVGTLAVRLHGPKGAFKINMRRHPDNDRTILVRYDPKHVGKYSVDITWSEVHIPGSPFTVNVSDQN